MPCSTAHPCLGPDIKGNVSAPLGVAWLSAEVEPTVIKLNHSDWFNQSSLCKSSSHRPLSVYPPGPGLLNVRLRYPGDKY